MVSDSLTDGLLPSSPSPFASIRRCRSSVRIARPPTRSSRPRWAQPDGSVRCVRCRNVWFAADPEALAAIAASPSQRCRRPCGGVRCRPRPRRPADDAPGRIRQTSAAGAMDLRRPRAVAAAGAARPRPPPTSRRRSSTTPRRWRRPTARPRRGPRPTPRPEDIEIGRRPPAPARRRGAAQSRWPLPGLPIAILAAARAQRRPDRLARRRRPGWLPQTASLYAAIGLPVNLRGLTFADVTTATETHDGVPVLVVEGTIVSASPRIVEVPRLRFSVRNAQRPGDLHLDRAAGAQRARARRDAAVPLAARVAAARGARGAGALLQPPRPRRRHPVR